jgi:carbon-monoxide dehydrogenase medium subunit
MPQQPDSYHRPDSLTEALTLLAKPSTAPLAGGTKLLATESGLLGTAVVDLQALGLGQARLVAAGGKQAIALGATLTLSQFSHFLQEELPESTSSSLLQTAIKQAGPNTYRNAATVGGSIASRLTDSTLLAALLVLDASVTLYAPSSHHTLSLADYLAEMERPSGLITTVTIPITTGRGASHQVARTPADYPIVSITGWRTTDGTVRLAATGLGERPFRLLNAENAAKKGDIDQAATAATAANSHPGDFRGDASYRAEMAAVLTHRTLNQLRNNPIT